MKKRTKSGKMVNYDKGEGVAGTPEDARRKDNPYYLLRNRFDFYTKKKYETGAELFEKALDYFKAVNDNPMKETKVFGSGIRIEVDLQIPYTLAGLCVFLGISQNTFSSYRKLDQREDASIDELSVCDAANKIMDIIFSQKIEGASSGKFNHAIVALELGLAAKVKTEKVVHDSSKMSAEEIKKFNESLEDEY